MCTNTCMFCVVYSSIQKFTIITIMKTAIFITIIFVISILSNYLNYRTALPCTISMCMHALGIAKLSIFAWGLILANIMLPNLIPLGGVFRKGEPLLAAKIVPGETNFCEDHF